MNKKIVITAACIVAALVIAVISFFAFRSRRNSYDNYQYPAYNDSLSLTGTSSLITYDHSLTEEEELSVAVAYFDSIGAKGVVTRVVNSESDEPDEFIIQLGYNVYYACYNNGVTFRVVIENGNAIPLPDGGN